MHYHFDRQSPIKHRALRRVPVVRDELLCRVSGVRAASGAYPQLSLQGSRVVRQSAQVGQWTAHVETAQRFCGARQKMSELQGLQPRAHKVQR
jgi:hypothetical protein